MSKHYDELSKEELIKKLDELTYKRLKEKATLKEFTTTNMLKDEDVLYVVPNGYIIGKPYVEETPVLSGYIIFK